MATRRSRQVPFYGWACEYCLEANPWNTQLLTTECSCPVVVPVDVAINDEGMLERIRPLPTMLPSGRFILCKNSDGSCYRGNHCTYAHSKAEQEAWNAQLETGGDSKIGSEFYIQSVVQNCCYFSLIAGLINLSLSTQVPSKSPRLYRSRRSLRRKSSLFSVPSPPSHPLLLCPAFRTHKLYAQGPLSGTKLVHSRNSFHHLKFSDNFTINKTDQFSVIPNIYLINSLVCLDPLPGFFTSLHTDIHKCV